METYSPDSIAVYTLVDPEQLEALRQRLTQAMEVLCALDLRLEYDRKIGVTRSAEEVARLRAESLKRTAGAESQAAPAAANGAGEPPVEVMPTPDARPAVQEPPAVESQPDEAARVEAQEQPAAEEEPLDALVVTEVELVSEPVPVPESELSAEVNPPEPRTPVAPPPPPVEESAAEPAAPVMPVAAKPAGARPLSRSLTPMPGTVRPAAHARPTAPVARHGTSVPPPLPPRNGTRSPLRAPNGQTQQQQLSEAPVLAQASAIATAESALAQVSMARDSRTRLKTVVDIPSDAEFNGELLRRVREGRNLSLQMLADRTRISSRHVESIEADRYDTLPAAVYLRGMLMSIARELGLDPLRVSRSYMGLVASGEKSRR
jgi:DNA-binding transcriptional regulator YiaG